MCLLLIAALVVVAVRMGVSSYLDATLFVAPLSFAGTIAAGRYLGTRRVY